jgi:phosphoglycolate phosphatase
MRAVLFDLDGTFADTAPDLGRAVNQMRAARGMGPVALSETRRVTSLGARGLLSAGFGMSPDHPDYAAMRDEFLQIYKNKR